jgi:hypothetical protein
MKPREQAQVIADVFEDAGWTTMPIKEAKFLNGYWFNTTHPTMPGNPATIWIETHGAKISVDGSGPAIRNRARHVLHERGLGEHLTRSQDRE